MSIDVAIASNRRLISYHSHRLPKDMGTEAIQLGIEALERLKRLRSPDPPFATAEALLPSETEEIKE